MYIDTHAHLYLEDFNEDIETVVENAKHAGIQQILLPNISASYIEPMNRLQKAYPELFRTMIGLHPGSVREDFETELDVVYKELQSGSYIAVGEIGTDLYWDVTYKDQQMIAFERQLNWAREFNLPVVIHARNSMGLTIETVFKQQNGFMSGVFHCFSGTLEEAEQIIGMGFYLGIGGVCTYKNSGLNEVLLQIGLEHLVLETDSPYLPPVPYRGKRNESS
ncbi:MAG TPA: hydrolase TatD, partial [Saprospirales bacterium]|nr:hydrolase TatD [Saprospirales bacterium]